MKKEVAKKIKNLIDKGGKKQNLYENIPGPALRVSIKLLISFPTVPTPSPSPEQITRLASQTAVTVTLRGQPFTCL